MAQFSLRRRNHESRLIEAARHGDGDASEALARLWWPRAYGAAVGVLADSTAAADVAQESVLAALANLDRFEVGRPSSPWLTRIATNKALDWIRSEMRQPDPMPTAREATAPGAVGDLLDLVEALAPISPTTRAMLVLHYLGGFDSNEIAEFLNTKPGTVRSAMSRVLAELETSKEVSG